jgi:malate dehydrogenase
LRQIVPLLSQSSHPLPSSLSADDHAALVHRIQFGGDEVVKAKDGAGSATLSMAYAGAEFAAKVLRAVKGEKGIVAPSYVNLTADPSGGAALKKDIGHDVEYFSSNVELGVRLVYVRVGLMFFLISVFNQPGGVVKIHSLGKITSAEQELVKAAVPELESNIQKVHHVSARSG